MADILINSTRDTIRLIRAFKNLENAFLRLGKELRRRSSPKVRARNVAKRMLRAVRSGELSSGIPLRCNRGIVARRMRAVTRVW